MAYNGLMGIEKEHHKFIYEQMGNILGRDVINFTTLLHKGAPYICGFDGLDYTDLTTLINHKVDRVEGFVQRITAFSDRFESIVRTNWKPNNFTMSSALLSAATKGLDKAVPGAGMLTFLFNIPRSEGQLGDVASTWNVLTGGG